MVLCLAQNPVELAASRRQHSEVRRLTQYLWVSQSSAGPKGQFNERGEP